MAVEPRNDGSCKHVAAPAGLAANCGILAHLAPRRFVHGARRPSGHRGEYCMLLSVLKDLARATRSRTSTALAATIRKWQESKVHTAATADDEVACRRLLERLPNHADAHVKLGVVLVHRGRLDEAEATFRRALMLQKGNAAAHYNLGILLARRGRLWGAESAYRSAIELLPDFVEAHNNLGVVLLRTDRFFEAEASFRRALELNPDFADARKNLELATSGIGRSGSGEGSGGQTLALAHGPAIGLAQLRRALAAAQGPWDRE